MARRCEICHKGTVSSFLVSHAHNRTKRKVYVNLQKVRALVNGKARRLHVCTKCIKSGKIQKA